MGAERPLPPAPRDAVAPSGEGRGVVPRRRGTGCRLRCRSGRGLRADPGAGRTPWAIAPAARRMRRQASACAVVVLMASRRLVGRAAAQIDLFNPGRMYGDAAGLGESSQSGHSASPARMEPQRRRLTRGHPYGFHERTATHRQVLVRVRLGDEPKAILPAEPRQSRRVCGDEGCLWRNPSVPG